MSSVTQLLLDVFVFKHSIKIKNSDVGLYQVALTDSI